jgi:hypothetical protein
MSSSQHLQISPIGLVSTMFLDGKGLGIGRNGIRVFSCSWVFQLSRWFFKLGYLSGVFGSDRAVGEKGKGGKGL